MTDQVLNVLHSKCYNGLSMPPSDAPDIRASFMLASQSGTTKLWALYLVNAEPRLDSMAQKAYNFTPSAKELETGDALTALSHFELEKEQEGWTAREAFTYPNASYFKETAPHHGYVFDLDTGKAVPLENAAVPTEGGAFDPSELSNASRIYADILRKAQQEQSSSQANPYRILFRQDSPPVTNLAAFFNMTNLETYLSEYYDGFAACDEYIRKIVRDENTVSDGEYSYRERIIVNPKFDVTYERSIYTYNNYLKAFKKAHKHARTNLKKMKPHIDDMTYRFLDDHLSALDLALQITCLKLKFSDKIKKGKAVSVQEFTKDVKSIIDGGALSQDMKQNLTLSAMDFDIRNIIPAVNQISDNIRDFKNTVDRKLKDHKNNVLQGRQDTTLSPNVLFTLNTS